MCRGWCGLFQPQDVAPSCGGVLASELVLDGVGKDAGAALLVPGGILLSAYDDGLRAVDAVDAVHRLVQPL